MIKKMLILLALSTAFSFSIVKRKQFVPPGTVRISETLFADETEISNQSWLQYEQWTRIKYGKDSKEYSATLPDTLVWRDPIMYNEPYVTMYYRHPAFKDYPVVGISYEQALAFCKWRTEWVKESFFLSRHQTINLEYRLPGCKEWEMISFNGWPLLFGSGKDSKGAYKLNCRYPESDTLHNSSSLTQYIRSYNKNPFGLFNIFGNVSEMTDQPGISKGGSWQQYLEECRAGKNIPYTRPTSWLGFRCVCTVIS